MAVERRAEADWPHWPDRSETPRRRERLERRLFSATDGTEAATPDQASEPPAGREPAPERGTHLLFVSSPQGYGLVEGHGEPPAFRDAVTFHGGEYVVAKLGRSPLPGDDRVCAFLEFR